MREVREGPGFRGALAVVGLALLFRVPGLDRWPPGLFVDEAYTVYDALSIARTGRDLWGNWFPVYFPSWGGDAVEGLYRYLCVPLVSLLGPTSLAARLPAALAGAAAVGFTYLLGRRLLGPWPALGAAVLLAVSPWHVAFSRVAFRGILVPTLTVITAWLVASAAGMGGPGTSRPRRFWLAALVLGLTLYTYSTAKLWVPLWLVLLVWVFRGELRRPRARAVGLLMLVILLAVPALASTLGGRGQVRFATISVFRPQAVEEAGDELARRHPALGNAARHPTVAVSWRLATNYLSHFHPRFLLTAGDPNLRHSPTGVGQFLWVEALLLIAGLVRAARRRSRIDLWLVGWLLLGPVADSLTTDRVPNALRALTMLPAPQLLAASGGAALFALLRGRGRALALGASVALVLLLAGETVRFAWIYRGAYLTESAPYWNAGYPEGVAWMAKEAPSGIRLAVARPEDWRVRRYALNPYYHSLILLYGAVPPEAFLERGMGRWEVLRIPEEGVVGPEQVPLGTWLLLPEKRADPGGIHHRIGAPGGGGRLGIVIGAGTP